ncbi:hypothetical protein Q1695_006183 [Nippostrongylus brasiliensis]|nr:hypothetical protein Q1695_006183 [Nippostrongylus brasiliensis]
MAAFYSNAHQTCEYPPINPRSYDDLLVVAKSLRRKLGENAQADVGIICGSGLGLIADQVVDPVILPYREIPGFPSTTVEGHEGNLVFGKLSGKRVVCMQGRFHPFEHNMDMALCAFPVRVMHQLGVKTLIISNSAGGINPNFQDGDLMLIKDQIFLPGLGGMSPLVGVNDARFGAHFVSVHELYDKPLRRLAMEVAKKEGMRLFEGIYVMTGGPHYETPAEVTMLREMGGDAVGMSTCPEVIVAAQCGIKVFGFSVITNMANTDIDDAVVVSHEQILKVATEASPLVVRFVKDIVNELPRL